MNLYTQPVVAADDQNNIYRQWDSEDDLLADVQSMSKEDIERYFSTIMNGVVCHYGDDQEEQR